MAQASNRALLRIGCAQAADIDNLLILERACFTDYYEQHRFGPADFAAYLRSARRIMYVAKLDSQLVGYVAGAVKRSRESLLAGLDSLAVQPAFRGRGIGDRLLQAFTEEAKRRNCRRILLTVAVPNDDGMRFFSKRGFRRVRRLADHYDVGVDGIVMRSNLGMSGGAS